MDKEDKPREEMKKPATEEDCKAGRAVFYVPNNRSTVYDLGRPLPLPARYRQDTEIGTAAQLEIIPAGAPVEIIQCEIGDNGEIVVGSATTAAMEFAC
jgi:ribosomal protein L2